MKKIINKLMSALVSKSTALLSIVMITSACSTTKSTNNNLTGKVTAKNCVIQEPIPGAKHTGAFMNLNVKDSNTKLNLISADVSKDITETVELHEMTMDNGIMKMQEIKNYSLKEGDNIFKKGGYHIMLMNTNDTLKAGDKHQITFNFDNAESISCSAKTKTAETIMKSMMHSMNMKAE